MFCARFANQLSEERANLHSCGLHTAAIMAKLCCSGFAAISARRDYPGRLAVILAALNQIDNQIELVAV